ncbi:MAG: hypothetical protein K6E70_06965 [Butyrivibrio sp.]|nr:hypothetical protein [Butyrivibrio sp.]
MEKQLAARIRQFPCDIMEIQGSLSDILQKISGWTKDGDDMQLRLLMPRLQYLGAMIDTLKGAMNDASAQIEETDVMTKQVIEQQLLSLESLRGQLSGITDAISVSVRTLAESDRKVLMADIMKRCSDLENAAKELK